MSDSEVAAYLAGADLARQAQARIEAGEPPPELEVELTGADWEPLRTVLGPDRFAFWVLRGVRDQLDT
jgi:hypothetical protein